MKKILIIDGDTEMREFMQIVLENEGYLAQVADSGSGALQTVRRSMPDVILLDVVMPGMDGWETIRRFRSIEELRDIPIVLCSGSSKSKYRFYVERPYRSIFLEKPFDMETLVGRIEECLRTFGSLDGEAETDSRWTSPVRMLLERAV